MSDAVVVTDPARRTATITKDFDADVARVWRLWTDPADLARWWGPPGHTTRVARCDLRAGGRVDFVVEDASGESVTACWHVHEVDPPWRLAFDFDDPRVPTVSVVVDVRPLAPDRTRTTLTVDFATDSAMRALLGLGFTDGLAGALDRAATTGCAMER